MHTNMQANSFLRLLYKLPLYKASIQGSSIRQCRCVRAVCRMAVGLKGNGTAEQFGRSMCCKKCRLFGGLTRAPGTRAPEQCCKTQDALTAAGVSVCPDYGRPRAVPTQGSTHRTRTLYGR